MANQSTAIPTDEYIYRFSDMREICRKKMELQFDCSINNIDVFGFGIFICKIMLVCLCVRAFDGNFDWLESDTANGMWLSRNYAT